MAECAEIGGSFVISSSPKQVGRNLLLGQHGSGPWMRGRRDQPSSGCSVT